MQFKIFFVSLVSVILLSVGWAARATTFNITSKIFIDGQLVSSPRIITKPNQKASIALSNEDKGLKLNLIAKDIKISKNHHGIGVSYQIEYQLANQKFYSKPQMIVIPNKESTISFSSAGHTYEMRVLAKRVV